MLPKEDRAKAKANCTEGMVTFDVRAYFNVLYRHGRAWRFDIRAWRFGNPCLKTVASTVSRREIFGILLNVLETSQTLNLLDTVNKVIFLAVIGRWKAKRFSASGGLRPLTPWPGALPLDPAGGSAPRPRYARHASVLLTLNLKIGTVWRVLSEICWQTDKQTDMLTTILRSPHRAKNLGHSKNTRTRGKVSLSSFARRS